MDKLLNFNVGILGHVDSGKTSLAKALSTIASTAAFDKNPQSQTRGITIDLGFSSFTVDAPSHILEEGYAKLQYTLVDCPGHASLIRTIIGGAQIIDGMILVIDIIKGMQTQTAECLVVGEIMCESMIVVLNKIDLLPEAKRSESINKISKKISNTLKNTKFRDAKIVSLSANPSDSRPIGMDDLVKSLKDLSYVPNRLENTPFVMLVDHCFGIKGQGTVITGTVLQGTVAINDNIEIPTMKITKKVKSIQIFRHPVSKASQGDRVGLCVTQFDPKLLERSIAGHPGYITSSFGFIAVVNKIKYYKQSVLSKARFHISFGHDTMISNIIFFGSEKDTNLECFSFDADYPFQTELLDLEMLDEDATYRPHHQFAFVEFEKAIPIRKHANFIASKLDMNVHTNACRLAFWGKILHLLPEDYKKEILPNLKVYKDKSREGLIDRMNSDNGLIAKNLLKKETDINLFSGLKVKLSTGERATIEGYFGQSGKVKLSLVDELLPETKRRLLNLKEGNRKNKKLINQIVHSDNIESVKVLLNFKKYLFNPGKKIIQSNF